MAQTKNSKSAGKRIIFLALAIALAFIPLMDAYASDDLTENAKKVADRSEDAYLREYRDHYYIDVEKMTIFGDALSVFPFAFTNAIFFLHRGLALLLISIFDFAQGFSAYTLFKPFIEPFMLTMKGTVFDYLAIGMIALFAIYFAINMLRNRTTQVITGLVQIVLILAIALVFFYNPNTLINGIDRLSEDVSTRVMDGSFETITAERVEVGEAKEKSYTLIWYMIVHKPWQILEFGSVDLAEARQESTGMSYQEYILKLDPDSDERKDFVNEVSKSEMGIEKKLFSKSFSKQMGNLSTALILFIFALAITLLLAALCMLIIGYQFLVIIYMFLGIFVFILALFPGFGLDLVKRWFIKLISAGCAKIVLTLILSVTMAFIKALFGLVDEYGLLSVLILILMFVGTVYWKRRELFDLFANFNMSAGANPNRTMNQILDRNYNGMQFGRDASESVQEGIWRYKNKKSADTEDKTAGRGSTIHTGAGNASMKKDEVDFRVLRENSGTIFEATKDIGQYMRRAEELLQEHYEKSKELKNDPASEEFVRRTDQIRENGGAGFDTRDTVAMANLIKKKVDQGIDQDDIQRDDIISEARQQSAAKKKRPPSLQGVVGSSDKAALKDQSNHLTHKNRPQGIDFFRANFGEEKGEQIYEDLMLKYDLGATVRLQAPEGRQKKMSYSETVKLLMDTAAQEIIDSGETAHYFTSDKTPEAVKKNLEPHFLKQDPEDLFKSYFKYSEMFLEMPDKQKTTTELFNSLLKYQSDLRAVHDKQKPHAPDMRNGDPQ